MEAKFHQGNRKRLCGMLPEGSVAVFFSGEEIRRTHDEDFPFFADRNFVYLTGLECRRAVLVIAKDGDGASSERIYVQEPDLLAERWTGARVKAEEAAERSGTADIRYEKEFSGDFRKLVETGNYGWLYLDLPGMRPSDAPVTSHRFLHEVREQYPYLQIGNGGALLRGLRLIKQPCEIAALQESEKITGAGIAAMMRASKPGMYEYQYKAEFDHALGQFGPDCCGFPPIIAAGRNIFCIHYYEYTGQAQDGDMVLNDVGTQYDNLITDVSRGWPCNGRYSERQRLLYDCAVRTSDYLFSVVKPGMKMRAVDETIRSYLAGLLKEAKVLKEREDAGTYLWHGGAHHIGYNVHDDVRTPEVIAPGMVFCIDVGIYHEEWGIGFRVEDNCLVTQEGCENLSKDIPRTAEEIEAVMGG